jgi:F-type H+-transporting ATPase subunit alpha
LDKGRKNVEILKQGQYTPMKVEHQIAIIYCGVKELLREVPIEKVKAFEHDFIELMEMQYRPVLDQLQKGLLTDNETQTIEKVAAEVAERFRE